MSSALDLVILNGPQEGSTVQLKPSEPTRLGRSNKGFQLVDPLVSLSHAQVSWEGDRYWIEDLGSATGTFINDVRLTERSACLVPGMRIRLGETDLEVVERPRSAVLRIAGGVAALVIVLLAVRSILLSVDVVYDPVIRWAEPIRQGGGFVSPELRIPLSFIRENGVDHRALTIRKVTDYDGDEVDEVWLEWPRGVRLVTFGVDGAWETLAELQPWCHEKSRTMAEGVPADCYVDRDRRDVELPPECEAVRSMLGGFPDIECAGTTLRHHDGAYRPIGLEGVITWMPPTHEVEVEPAGKRKKGSKAVIKRMVKDGPPVPYQFTLTETDKLAGFLAQRGIEEPIHFLVCEEALPGLRAQVMLADGTIRPLAYGCINDFEVLGYTRAIEFGDGMPKMFAFTAHGHRAILDGIAGYLSGGADGLFMHPSDLAVHQTLGAEPTRRLGNIRIAFEGPERVADPIAPEELVETDDRLLVSEFVGEPPPTAHTVLIDGPGRYELEGCGDLEVQTHDWTCASVRGCGATSSFLQLRSLGCGDGAPMQVPYAAGLHALRDGPLELRVAVETVATDDQIDVLRVRLGHRVVSRSGR